MQFVYLCDFSAIYFVKIRYNHLDPILLLQESHVSPLHPSFQAHHPHFLPKCHFKNEMHHHLLNQLLPAYC